MCVHNSWVCDWSTAVTAALTVRRITWGPPSEIIFGPTRLLTLSFTQNCLPWEMAVRLIITQIILLRFFFFISLSSTWTDFFLSTYSWSLNISPMFMFTLMFYNNLSLLSDNAFNCLERKRNQNAMASNLQNNIMNRWNYILI